eukprot:GHVO01038101.1.p1 GENE.GHVO01038101.1~~GHVO01038101.1.p1  ORF type:complete len:129 (+),score=41.02 GHVO01038101.1:59-445(+)
MGAAPKPPPPRRAGGGGGGGGKQTQMMLEVGNDEDVVTQRALEISRIGETVNEIHQIFQDVAHLVVDQGTILDRIDFTIEQTAVQTATAKKHLISAERYQKSGRATRIIMFLVLGIGILLVIFVLKHI